MIKSELFDNKDPIVYSKINLTNHTKLGNITWNDNCYENIKAKKL